MNRPRVDDLLVIDPKAATIVRERLKHIGTGLRRGEIGGPSGRKVVMPDGGDWALRPIEVYRRILPGERLTLQVSTLKVLAGKPGLAVRAEHVRGFEGFGRMLRGPVAVAIGAEL